MYQQALEQKNIYHQSQSQYYSNQVPNPSSLQVQPQGKNNEFIVDTILGSKYSFAQSICPQCEQRFNKKSHLYRHIRQKHEQTRQFVCIYEDCNKKFKRGSHLKRHMISHTHQKNFKCANCILEFGYKHHLDRHIKIVHDKELFKCQLCGNEFSKKRGLAKHKKQHEKIQTKRAMKKNKHKQLVEAEKVSDQGSNIELKLKGVEKKNKKIKKNQKIIHKKSLDDSIQDILSKQDCMQLFQQSNLEESQDRKEDEENTNNFKLTHTNFHNEIIPKQKLKSQSDVILYRCSHSECLCAYKTKYALKNHIKNMHQGIQSS